MVPFHCKHRLPHTYTILHKLQEVHINRLRLKGHHGSLHLIWLSFVEFQGQHSDLILPPIYYRKTMAHSERKSFKLILGKTFGLQEPITYRQLAFIYSWGPSACSLSCQLLFWFGQHPFYLQILYSQRTLLSKCAPTLLWRNGLAYLQITPMPPLIPRI